MFAILFSVAIGIIIAFIEPVKSESKLYRVGVVIFFAVWAWVTLHILGPM